MARKFTKYPSNYVKASSGEPDVELMTFAESISLEPLYDKIKEVTGLSDLVFTDNISWVGYSDGACIEFKSQDIADRTGFLDLMFKNLYIQNFNSHVKRDSETGEMYWWGDACFRYKLQSLGSNGSDFMSFEYRESTGWRFLLEKDKYSM